MENMNFLPLMMFMLSVIGMIINSSNIILVLICIEIMLLSMSLNFLLHSYITESLLGQISSIYIITVAAVESAMGLSMMISFYKISGSMAMSFLNLLKG